MSETRRTPDLYAIQTTLAKAQSEMDAHLDEHLVHQDDLERQGILWAAGPFLAPDGTPTGDGLIIVRAASLDAAQQIADSDPLHQLGIRTYTVRPWQLNEGQQTIQIQLSSQSVRLS